MDIVADKYHAELIISGVSQPVELNGSLLTIMQLTQLELRKANCRANKDGKTITLRISDKPIVAKTMTIAEQNAKMDKELGLAPDDVGRGPHPGESYESFHEYLCTRMPELIATQFANDWFGRAQDPLTEAWKTDPKIKRFNAINASSAAFAEALPSEYESLKQYIKSTYPSFAERIKWRTAF